jgi:hypothetical protein
MNILHLSNTPLSNAPENLAVIQRAAGHKSLALLNQKNNTNGIPVGGTCWFELDPDVLRQTFEKADVIHLHNFAWTQEVFLRNPDLLVRAKMKPCLIQYHSPRHTDHNFEDTIKDPFFKGRKAVLAQYQARYYPEAEHVVPNVIPLFQSDYMPMPNRTALPTMLVSYSPSNTNLRGWDDKGYPLIEGALRNLAYGGRVRTETIANTPYKEALLKKRWAEVGIEEVVTGSYHLSFLEYMSVGAATICNLDDATRAAMAMVVGHDAVQELPAIRVTPHTFIDELHKLVANRAHAMDVGHACRAWMERHWNPRDMVGFFTGIYNSL